MLFDLESVEERAALSEFGQKVDLAREFIDDQFADHKTQADAIGVQFPFFILNGAEELEKLILVLFLYAYTVVNN